MELRGLKERWRTCCIPGGLPPGQTRLKMMKVLSNPLKSNPTDQLRWGSTFVWAHFYIPGPLSASSYPARNRPWPALPLFSVFVGFYRKKKTNNEKKTKKNNYTLCPQSGLL